jgi:transcription initiation factor TFIIIB Brf1 subunit/transcription initiation factor TFIIB
MSSVNEPKVSQGTEVIEEISERLRISKSIVEEAKEIFSKALKDKNLKKRNPNHLGKASLYLACRLHDEPVPFNSIGGLYIEERKKVFRTYKSLKKSLNTSVTPVDDCDLLRSFCFALELPEDVREAAEGILKRSKDDGRNPQTKVLASILLASSIFGYRISLKKMHEATGSNITIVRNAARDMAEELGIDHFSEMTKRLCDLLSPSKPEMKEKAVSVLKEARELSPDIVRRPANALASGVVYFTAKLLGMTVSLKNVANLAEANKQTVEKTFYDLKNILEDPQYAIE